MRNFDEYIRDKKHNSLYYLAKKYSRPDYFMSFTEATWRTKNASKIPNGITAFPIQKTMNLWEETDEGNRFSLFTGVQNKIYILYSPFESAEYTNAQYESDLSFLNEHYGFQPNRKLIANYRKAMKGKRPEIAESFVDAIYKEENKFKVMVNEATEILSKPEDKLLEVTKWLAAGGKNPDKGFEGNASQRWTNILRKIGYSAFVVENIALFLDVNAFEVVDEISN